MDNPCDFVIFGGTGDLAVRKLLPALYLRDRDGELTADTRIIAVARAGLDEAGYRDKVHAELGRFVATELLDADTVDRFLARLRFVSIDLTEPGDYVAVTDALSSSSVDIRVFYLACAPALFGPICDALGRQGLVTASSRVVLEKPIGRDLASAQAINDAVGSVFDERVYPNGRADVNHFHAAGGMAFVINSLLDAGLMHSDVRTVAGDWTSSLRIRTAARR